MRNYDPFQQQKEDSFTSTLPMMKQLAKHLLPLLDDSYEKSKKDFINLLKVSIIAMTLIMLMYRLVVKNEHRKK